MSGKPRNLLIRADAGNEIGLGHVRRCQYIVNSLGDEVTTTLVMKGQPAPQLMNDLSKQNWQVVAHERSNGWLDDAEQTIDIARSHGARVVVTDLCHREHLDNPAIVGKYHDVLMMSKLKVMSIEDCRMTSFTSDVAVVPYQCPGEPRDRAMQHCEVLCGLEYAIFSSGVVALSERKRKLRTDACRVLVCIGGADPKACTLLVMHALCDLAGLRLRFVAGPAMRDEQLASLRRFASGKKNIDVLTGVSDLADHLEWCDVAVTGEGLVKFEAAVTGTPTILISQFDHDSALLHDFLGIGSVQYLGAIDALEDNAIANAVSTLLADIKKRRSYSDAGKAYIDCHGVTRVCERLHDLLNN